MDIIITIVNSFWAQAIIRLLVGFGLSSIIGLERSSWNKPAGFKTHSLVCMSAVLVMLCGEYMSMNYNIDPSRIAAQLLSGIGFIGAGTILREGFNVKGLTTAASLLAVTCIGLSIGTGFYIGGIAGTVMVYLILSYSYVLSDKVKHGEVINIEIKTKKDAQEIIEKTQKILEIYNINIKSIKIDKESQEDDENEDNKKTKDYMINIICESKNMITKNELITQIVSVEGVTEVKEERLSEE